MERDVVLTTPRMILTTWAACDLDALFEVHSDPETMRYVRHGRPESRHETEQLLHQYITEQDARGWTKWRLVDRDGAFIGRAGFGSHEGDRQLAYTIRRSRWGGGLATEIASALVAWHRSGAAPGVPLGATVATGNDRSARVLQKVGFLEVGTRDYDGTICRLFRYPEPEWGHGRPCPTPPNTMAWAAWHG